MGTASAPVEAPDELGPREHPHDDGGDRGGEYSLQHFWPSSWHASKERSDARLDKLAAQSSWQPPPDEPSLSKARSHNPLTAHDVRNLRDDDVVMPEGEPPGKAPA